MLKKIEAVVRKEVLPRVLEALDAIGIPGVTTYEVHGFGKGRAREASPATYEGPFRLARKHKVEVVAESQDAVRIVEAIRGAACTGRPGDGKIFIAPIDDCVKIRSGDRGEEAV